MAQNQRKAGKAGRQQSSPAKPKRQTISFDYIKSNYYRVILADGVIGGLAPNGTIHMAVWNQRQPYPRQVVHELTSDDTLGEETKRLSREAELIREIEVGLVFSPALARSLIHWLELRLAELAEAKKAHDAATRDEEPQETDS